MKNLQFVIVLILLSTIISCSGSSEKKNQELEKKYIPGIGIGKYKSVENPKVLSVKLVKQGDDLYMQKCASCHDLSDKIIAAPGWNGVTKRRNAAWIMNLMTNTEEMLEYDVVLKSQIETYKMIMPDFWLTEGEAFAILEFMRKNDLNEVNRNRELPSACEHIRDKK